MTPTEETITIPHPENPGHTDNLCTIPLLEAQGFEGSDVSLTISLFEYDPIWRKLPPYDPDNIYSSKDEDYLFIYRIRGEKDHEKQFDRQAMNSKMDFAKDYSWIGDGDWADFWQSYDTNKAEWEAESFHYKIYTLAGYFGYENIFGSSYWDGFKVRDVDHDYGMTPAPGESPADYHSRLLYGDDSPGGEPGMPGTFIRTETGVWFESGGMAGGLETHIHQWHSDTDAVYAAGSLVCANEEVPLDVLRDAIDQMERNVERADNRDGEFNKAHGEALLEVLKAALAAEPSEEPQRYEG